MLDQDKILNFLRTIGPTLPSKVAKNIGTEILFASAHLSFLVSQGKLKISSLKVGGSPLYYLAGQEAQLYPFAAGNINPKELQVLDRLKEESVLREADLDLLSKVALRSLKDFAVPLHVTVKNKRELFWKWYLLSSEETKVAIGNILKESETEELEETNKESAGPEPELQVAISNTAAAVTEAEMIEPKLIQVIKEEPDLAMPLIVPDEQKKLTDSKSDDSKLSKTTRKKSLAKRKITAAPDPFLTKVNEYLNRLEIAVNSIELIRKNSEFNLKVDIPSIVGKTTYLCKARKKHRVDEKDVSAAYMEAQIMKLPLLFLYTHQITKRAEDMLKTEAFSNAVVKRI